MLGKGKMREKMAPSTVMLIILARLGIFINATGSVWFSTADPPTDRPSTISSIRHQIQSVNPPLPSNSPAADEFR